MCACARYVRESAAFTYAKRLFFSPTASERKLLDLVLLRSRWNAAMRVLCPRFALAQDDVIAGTFKIEVVIAGPFVAHPLRVAVYRALSHIVVPVPDHAESRFGETAAVYRLFVAGNSVKLNLSLLSVLSRVMQSHTTRMKGRKRIRSMGGCNVVGVYQHRRATRGCITLAISLCGSLLTYNAQAVRHLLLRRAPVD